MNKFKIPPWMTALCAVILLGMLAHVPLTANKGHCPVLSAIHPTEAMASQATANSTVSVQGVLPSGNCCKVTGVDEIFGHTNFQVSTMCSIARPAESASLMSATSALAKKTQSSLTATMKKVSTNLERYKGNPAAHASGIAGNTQVVNSTFTYYTGARDSYVDRAATIQAAGTISDTDYGGTGTNATWAANSIENGYGGAQSGNHQNTTDVNIEHEMAVVNATYLPASMDIYDLT